jgi:hypothetical protein
MSTIAELKASMEAARAQIKEHGQAAFKAELATFFNDNPDVEALRWTQYTPYFNDGEPCVFGASDLTIKRVGSAGDEGDDEDGFEHASWGDKKHKNACDWWKGANDDDVLLASFGDHVQVTATRDGISVDEYSHD